MSFRIIPDSRLSMVDLEDIGEIVSKIALNCEHYYSVYPLVGEQSITYTKISNIFSQKMGTDIKIRNISIDSWKEKAHSSGMAEEKILILSKMFEFYDKFGFIGNINTLSYLLNRQPIRFNQFIDRDVHL